MNPQARQDKLLIEEVGDELVIYDRERHNAHRLNRTAALVWRHCDGTVTVAELADLLREQLELPEAEQVVWLALDRLDKAHLLRESPRRPAEAEPISRRRLLGKLKLAGAAAFLLPVVATLLTPGSAQAAKSGY